MLAKKLTEEVNAMLDDRNYPYSNIAVENIIMKSLEAKKYLIQMFSKHPLWNPEKLMIVFDQDYTREIDIIKVKKFLDTYTPYSYLKLNIDQTYNNSTENNDLYYHTRVLEMLNKITHLSGQYFDTSLNKYIDDLNSLNDEFKLRNNMKLSKAVRKVCSVMGWDKFENFEKAYADFADAANPLKVKRHTVISLHPNDFLLMSNGKSWYSCHDIGCDPEDSGCYSSGTISYMLDEHSFIFYTVDSTYDGHDIDLEAKITRQVFGYNEGSIAQLRLYPASKDRGAEEEYKNTREIVQKVIAECLGENNLWTKRRKSVEDFIQHGKYATCYPDWQSGNPGSSHCIVSTLNKYFNPKIRNHTFTFGAEPICINCGCFHNHEENILCEDCYDDTKVYCENCNTRLISENDRIYIDGDCYCEDCVEQCDCCGEYVPKEDLEYIDGESICSGCINSGDYYKCERCGEVHHIDNMYKYCGDLYCEDCYSGIEKEEEEDDEM